ncbi:MAG: hypothetical protein D3917_12880 [Candidatus Electrothrix sp. AX5]|jgi:hypothetical protein|uniref:PilZ domain-containing protein n=1 Tax=Candidatus Electrothrix aarhusensis TaxID=1859131 RepID=A0A3S3R3B4_9BACT|nr:hypothetical protein [Candidatus Electrothrix sp. AX5]RWX43196.1 hypothetical protein H206_03053 [Candidatus Electrothrix aarhusensis]
MNVQFDKRRFQRVDLSGDTVTFLDYGCYYKGLLTDVSYNGFRVTFTSIGSQVIFWPNLSLFFSATIWRIRKFRIVISTTIVSKNADSGELSNRTRKNYLMSAYPRWMRKTDTKLEIGFKIPESSVGWQFFVLEKMENM